MPDPTNKFTAKDWDDVRKAFADSIMVKTPLTSLAQNLDGPDWPVKGKDETPSEYLGLSYDEMISMLAIKGIPASKADFLISLLKDTLSFDSPFGEMAQQTEASALKDNQLLKNLTKLGIPEAFPMKLAVLTPSTAEFCKLEKLGTLGEFCVFSQGMSQNVIVGGDFRKLLNALSHVDEASVAECLPFRAGGHGLHLLEALVQASRAATPATQTKMAIEWFKDEYAGMRKDLSAGGSLQRHLMVLNNLDSEKRASDMLAAYAKAEAAASGKQGGVFSSLRRLFGK